MKPLLLLLLSMSISGSLAFIIYLVVIPFSRKSISAGFQYIALKFCLMLFLIPFPLIKHLMYHSLLPHTSQTFGNFAFLDLTNSINQTNNGFFIYLSYIQKWFLFVWGIVLLLILFFQLFRLFHLKKLVTHHLYPDTKHESLIAKLHKEFHLLQPIKVYYCDAPISPFTYGIFRPVILLTSLVPEDLYELALRHEIQYIKTHDFFYRLLIFGALLLHCFNPFIYIFFKEFMEVQEMNCDEKLLPTLSLKEQKQYGHMLIDIASLSQTAQSAPFTAIAFSKTNSALLKKRVCRLTFSILPRKSRLCLMLCLMFLGASVPVYAYQPSTLDLRDFSYETCHHLEDADWVSIELSAGTRLDYMPMDEATFASCDSYLLLEDGTILLLETSYSPSPSAACSHSYVNATYKEHLKKGSGCTVNIYNAQVCTKCHAKKIGSLIGANTYVKCPH